MSAARIILAGLISLSFAGASVAQTGKTLDSAQQKERVKKMPMDTSGLQPGKYKNPEQGGEHSGKNIDNQKKQAKPEAPKKDPQSRLDHKRINSATAVAYYCKKCGYKSSSKQMCPKDGSELIRKVFITGLM